MNKVVVAEVLADDVAETWPVMRQLRPHLDLDAYVTIVARMRSVEGFRLAAASVEGRIGAVAGFRVIEMLYSGRVLQVDDLVTDEASRSLGLGTAMLDWLTDEARRQDCGQIHLDSGVHRLDAHRFYEREGFQKLAWHFAARVMPGGREPSLPVSHNIS